MIDYKDLLEGKLVILWPYSNKYFPQETLLTAWRTINDSGAAYKAFWPFAQAKEKTTVDLPFFMDYMNKCALLLVQNAASKELIGLIWFDDIQIGHRANANIFFIRKGRGPWANEASEIAIQYAFKAFMVKSLWGFTPWPEAVKHAERAGFKYVASLPDYALIHDELKDVHILRF